MVYIESAIVFIPESVNIFPEKIGCLLAAGKICLHLQTSGIEVKATFSFEDRYLNPHPTDIE